MNLEMAMFDVLEFMKLGHADKIAATPRIPPTKVRALCKSLITEEVRRELLPAMEASDIVEIADAIADSVYVLLFTAHCYGIPLDRVWDEVATTNLLKVSGEVHYDNVTGKILKPPGWKPPNIERIIAAAIPRQQIFCPYCRKQHIDAESFAITPHLKHLCDLTPEGEGCGKTWQMNELVFGI